MVNNYEDLIVTDSWRQAADRKAAKLLAGLEKESVQDEEEDDSDDEALLERINDSDIDMNATYPLICHGKDNDGELEQQEVLDYLERIKWDEE